MRKSKTPWTKPMPADDFNFMRQVLSAPSPIGYEAALTFGVIEPYMRAINDKWDVHKFKGNAGLVVDTGVNPLHDLTIMLVAHADKIRLQVRSIGEDGKIWVNSDSFLPTTLIGHEVTLYSEDPKNVGQYRPIEGGTIEALGAIHFTSDASVDKKKLYLDLQMYGANPKKRIKALGIKTGDPIILNRPIKRGFSANTFYGAYLDDGLGCYALTQIAKLMYGVNQALPRTLFAFTPYEEIGRFGSSVAVNQFNPDVIIALDVAHDYDAAPGISDKRMPSVTMGEGFVIDSGSITSGFVNKLIEVAARKNKIPYQVELSGRDTGTDAMAGVMSNIDTAAVSIGIPCRNMHTISEIAHTGDVQAAIWGIFQAITLIADQKITGEDLKYGHVRLDKLK